MELIQIPIFGQTPDSALDVYCVYMHKVNPNFNLHTQHMITSYFLIQTYFLLAFDRVQRLGLWSCGAFGFQIPDGVFSNFHQDGNLKDDF